MSDTASQSPVLLSVYDRKNNLKQVICPIEAIKTPTDLLATIVEAFGFVFPGGRPSEEGIQIEFQHHDQLDLRNTFVGLKRIIERKQQEYINPTSFGAMLQITVRFHSIIAESSPINFEFTPPNTFHGLAFQKEIHDFLETREKYKLNVARELLTTMLWNRPSTNHDHSKLQSTQNELSIQQEQNRDLPAQVQELKQTQFTQSEWAQINYTETSVYAERLDEQLRRTNEELEQTSDRVEEKIDGLLEENKRLEGCEVQAAELDEKLRKLIAEAQDGSVDVATLPAIWKSISRGEN